MGTVDDPAVILGISVCLSAELETKVLDDVWGVLAGDIDTVVVEKNIQFGGRAS